MQLIRLLHLLISHIMEHNLNVAGNVRANGIRLGFTNGTTIDTVSGDLTLDSSNNKVVSLQMLYLKLQIVETQQ